jgi:hypothetical protein
MPGRTLGCEFRLAGDGGGRTSADLCDYIHLNPVRAGLVKAGKDLATYRWSSYPWYLKARSQRPVWLEVEKVLGEFGVQDRAEDRRWYEENLRRLGLEAAKPSVETEDELRELRGPL